MNHSDSPNPSPFVISSAKIPKSRTRLDNCNVSFSRSSSLLNIFFSYFPAPSNGVMLQGYRPLTAWAYSTSVEEVMNDRDNKSALYFNHHVLGIPYEDKRTGLSLELFRSISRPELRYGYDPRYLHLMGVDQGAYITIWRMIPLSRADLFPFGKWQMVHAEFCPDSMAFKTFNKGPDGRLIPKPGRLNELMEQWKIVMCVIDGEPSGNDALNFQQDYVKEKRV